MLVLSRKANESILIGDHIRLVVTSVSKNQVRLGIEAPRAVRIVRGELLESDARTILEFGTDDEVTADTDLSRALCAVPR